MQMLSEITIHKIEQCRNVGVALLVGDYQGNSVWLYVLINKAKENMLMGMSKFFPLKLQINDYGRIIKSGEGLFPPKNIAWQIDNGDFSGDFSGDFLGSNSEKESEVFCLLSKTEEGREFYHYVDVPYYLNEKFAAMQASGQDFELENYGEILQSGWGKPSDEIIAMMSEKYGIAAPMFEGSCH